MCRHDRPYGTRRDCLKGAAGATLGLFTSGVAEGWSSLFAAQASPDPGSGRSLSGEESLRLAGRNLLNILNPEDNYLPYWELSVTPQYEAALKRWWPAHNIGRWLDAMLRLEETLDVDIPEEIDRAMQENVRAFFDNPDRISLNPKPWPLTPWTTDTGLQWDLHSIREGMLALNALARWRASDWAVDMGRQMIRSLDAKLRDDGSWDVDAFEAPKTRIPEVIHNIDPQDTHGRLIEALIWFYETTGAPEAIRFAHRLAQWHLENSTLPDGSLNPQGKIDHTHSYFGTLRGLLLYGRLTHQRTFVERVAVTYEKTVRRFVKESGYTSHNMAQESFGETTSPGDAAQLALWLTLEGYSEYLDDADRLVRSRILPSQILETPPLKPLVQFGKDATTNLESRIIGGYGGCHSHPHAHKLAVTDVTAADVHSLVDVYRHITVPTAAGLEVFFHLDVDNADATVACRRAEQGTLSVTPKKETAIAIRVPQWTPRESVKVRIGAEEVEPTFAGHFLRTGKVSAGTPVTIAYALPEKRIQETGLGKTYEVHFRGDDVIGVSPNTDFYPFYK